MTINRSIVISRWETQQIVAEHFSKLMDEKITGSDVDIDNSETTIKLMDQNSLNFRNAIRNHVKV